MARSRYQKLGLERYERRGRQFVSDSRGHRAHAGYARPRDSIAEYRNDTVFCGRKRRPGGGQCSWREPIALRRDRLLRELHRTS